MNKKLILLAMLVAAIIILSSCGNRQIGFDTAQSFNKAYVRLGNEWKEVNVKSWRDFDNGDEVQIVTEDGIIYLSHYCNMVLVSGK